MTQSDFEVVPVSIDIRTFILQEHYPPWVMATHFTIGVMDYTVLVIFGKQLQTTRFYGLHLKVKKKNWKKKRLTYDS